MYAPYSAANAWTRTMSGHRAKAFDCVGMHRRIQERLDAGTRGMDDDDLRAWLRRRGVGRHLLASFPAADVGDLLRQRERRAERVSAMTASREQGDWHGDGCVER